MKGLELYRLGACRCSECLHHGKDGWCKQWKAYTDDNGFCYKAEMKETEFEDDLGLAEERERENERYED